MRLLSDDQRKDLLITALEGESNYWYLIPDSETSLLKSYRIEGESTAERIFRIIQEGKFIKINDLENPEETLGRLSLFSLKTGEKLMFKKYPYIFADILKDEWDAWTADVWFQCCIMGELVFG